MYKEKIYKYGGTNERAHNQTLNHNDFDIIRLFDSFSFVFCFSIGTVRPSHFQVSIIYSR